MDRLGPCRARQLDTVSAANILTQGTEPHRFVFEMCLLVVIQMSSVEIVHVPSGICTIREDLKTGTGGLGCKADVEGCHTGVGRKLNLSKHHCLLEHLPQVRDHGLDGGRFTTAR